VQLRRSESRLSFQIRIFGPDGGPTSKARSAVARNLEKLGRHSEALLLREEVFAANRRHLGIEHPFTLQAEGSLALTQRAIGNVDEARRLFAHTYEIRMRTQGPDNEKTIKSKLWLDAIEREKGER
jgi:hypothetical protein